MADIRYKRLIDPATKEDSQTHMMYFDMDGTAWTFALGSGHRFEQEMLAFVAAGGEIEAADVPTP